MERPCVDNLIDVFRKDKAESLLPDLWEKLLNGCSLNWAWVLQIKCNLYSFKTLKRKTL